MESGDEMKKKWIKIYPQYIDKGIKHSEGRKLNNEVSIDNPTTRELFFVCSEVLRLDCREEKKHHPKDWMKRGRLIVGLKHDGKSLDENIKKKNELLKFVADSIKKKRETTKVDIIKTDDGDKKRRKKNR